MRVGDTLSVSSADLDRLRALVSDRNAPQKHVWRARIVLLTGEGVGTSAIMRETSKSKTCVWRWQERFADEGFEGLLRDKTRPSRIPKLDPAVAERVVTLTMEPPVAEATHWTGAAMAEAAGVSVSSVQRIWRSHGLQPHRIRQFKLSKDPAFVDKLRDVVGLYVDPPAHTVVLSVDEKSQIQALDRTQPGLPMKKGRCGTMTHDYKRNGTTTLFAAMSTLDGQVIGSCMPRHRHQEWLKFLKQIDRETPAAKEIHLIADNYSTHKHAVVLRWIARHPRFHLHFTPTSASWLNMVERFFRHLTEKQISRGVFRSVDQLETAILGAIEQHNSHPKPYIWTAKASDILEKVKRARRALNKVPSV
jgi:transposase